MQPDAPLSPARTRVWFVVPCYNEAQRFQPQAFEAYLSSTSDVGFVLVNDGSTDHTLTVLLALAARFSERVHVLDQQPNQGKAAAVRAGMLRALELGCEHVGYLDADLATPLSELAAFRQVLESSLHIEAVLGARLLLLGRVIERRAVRHYLGRVFATVASLVLDLPVYDTQCGAKLFRVTPRLARMLAKPFGTGWIFDVELLARYLEESGRPSGLYELPLNEWRDVGGSKVKASDFLRAIGEMAFIYRRYQRPRHAAAFLWLFSLPITRYVSAGAIGTAAHYAVLAALVEALAVPPSIATALGAVVGAATNYVLNYHLTFASRASHLKTLPRFTVVALLIAALNWYGMTVAVEKLGWHYLLAQVVCTLAGLLAGFVLNKLWTFRERSLAISNDPEEVVETRPAREVSPPP